MAEVLSDNRRNKATKISSSVRPSGFIWEMLEGLVKQRPTHDPPLAIETYSPAPEIERMVQHVLVHRIQVHRKSFATE
jgi:hypothetical protein